MNPLVVIPARAGSKGLPSKNIKELGGLPLILHTLKAARDVFPNERICVSTDCSEVLKIVEGQGVSVDFMRPAELASDTAEIEGVLLHATDFYIKQGLYIDSIVLLQPTSPLRSSEHVKESIELYSEKIDMVASVKVTEVNPYYLLKEEDESGFLIPSKKGDFTRRQDCPEVYELNGAIYIINLNSLYQSKIRNFKKVVKYLMSARDSVDIDTQIDWDIASYYFNQKRDDSSSS